MPAAHQKTGNIRLRRQTLETVVGRVVARLTVSTEHAVPAVEGSSVMNKLTAATEMGLAVYSACTAHSIRDKATPNDETEIVETQIRRAHRLLAA
jgi:hypothetical protein